MRLVIQRVSNANVVIEGREKAKIGHGMLILVGIQSDDTAADIDWLVRKVVAMRIFDDADGVMNLPITEVNGDIIVVSQFTLMASTKKGNRPSWIKAAPHDISIPLYNEFCQHLEAALGKSIGTGEFGADMKVSLTNDGPVTIIIDSKNKE